MLASGAMGVNVPYSSYTTHNPPIIPTKITPPSLSRAEK